MPSRGEKGGAPAITTRSTSSHLRRICEPNREAEKVTHLKKTAELERCRVSPFVQGAIGGRILVRNEEGNGIVDENAPAPEEKVRPDLHISLR
jgi:hypothetical protein